MQRTRLKTGIDIRTESAGNACKLALASGAFRVDMLSDPDNRHGFLRRAGEFCFQSGLKVAVLFSSIGANVHYADRFKTTSLRRVGINKLNTSIGIKVIICKGRVQL